MVLVKRQNTSTPRLESLARLSSIPLVETGVKTAESVYYGLKKRNRFLNWSFDTAEGVVLAAVESVQPAVKLIERPIHRIDEIMCKSLDMVEQRIPSVYLPPQMMYSNTREYVSDHFVRPVLKRANSVKHIGSAVLDSRVSSFAAHQIEGAIDVADKYVEKYLPAEDQTDSTSVPPQDDDKDENQAVHTFHKGQRFSRKLKRRLTQRTFAEARALKKQSKEAIHILFYAAELIATDPKLALTKARELWTYLSQDEPENQARPHTLEQLIVLLTRESARKLVHLVNFTRNIAENVPSTLIVTTRELVHQFLYITESLLKTVQLDKVKSKAVQDTNAIKTSVNNVYDELQQYTTNTLERLAIFLSGRLEAEKITVSSSRRSIRSNNNPMQNNINGVC